MQNQQIDIVEYCTDIGLNGQFLDILEKFCYFGDTKERGTVDNFFNKDQESRPPHQLSNRWSQSEEKRF